MSIEQLADNIQDNIQEQVENQVSQIAPAAFLGILGTLMRNITEVDDKLQVVLDEATLNVLADMIYPGVHSLGYNIDSRQTEDGGLELRLVPLASVVGEGASNV